MCVAFLTISMWLCGVGSMVAPTMRFLGELPCMVVILRCTRLQPPPPEAAVRFPGLILGELLPACVSSKARAASEAARAG